MGLMSGADGHEQRMAESMERAEQDMLDEDLRELLADEARDETR